MKSIDDSPRARNHNVVRLRKFRFDPVVFEFFPHGREGRSRARARARELNEEETGNKRGPFTAGLLRQFEPYVDLESDRTHTHEERSDGYKHKPGEV